MQSSKSNWRRLLIAGVCVCLLIVVLGVIAFWKLTSTSTGESSARTTESSELQETSANGAPSPRTTSTPTGEPPQRSADNPVRWISFERALLLAVVVANYLLLAVVAWRLWRGQRWDIDNDLSKRLQAMETRLEAIERAPRAEPLKATTPPAPATPEPAPKAKGNEPSRELAFRPGSRSTEEPMQRGPDFRETPFPLARTEPVPESRRTSESNARQLVNQYCSGRGGSIVDLREHAQALGLQIGSPSSTPRQRNSLHSPDPDTRLLAIKDSREEKFFVVVGADANVTEMEWLDLFERRGFPGYRDVRSKRPAVVDAVSGEVEEKGELEVLG